MGGIEPGDFTLVARATATWPQSSAHSSESVSPTATRLLRAVAACTQPTESVGPSDLAVLVRQVLRSEALISGGDKSLRVPTAPPWPTPAAWRRHGVLVLGTEADRLRIQAEPWHPQWLEGAIDPATAAFTGAWDGDSAGLAPLSADPFFAAATGRAAYRSQGQKHAVRWLVSAPPGATLIANLPTGSGKSTVGYLPALLGQSRGTVLFVVPTTSLALDQARAFRALVEGRPDARSFPRELAYHSELSTELKAAIRQRVADGTQRMLFTSPEALLSGLSAATYKAAEQGLVTAIVVDEAHVVAQWGTEFRPDFQALAGVREDLLAVCATNGFDLPPTVLLSATLTQDSLEALGGLFARPGPTSVVSAVSLRHEPSYWLSDAISNEERSSRVVEALRHVPRPAIVYTTRVADAKELHALLVSEGYRRVAVVAGDTTAADRRAVIDRLRDQSLDLVVATSAFGLGVDQPDVRTVIHACIPETLDRWYQEVGRGGRDGHPSVALLIATDTDYGLARDLSRRKVVTLETGRERWDAMAARAVELDGGRLRLSLSSVPARLDVDSPRNRAWNVRTLLLLHRAGVVALEAEPPPRREEDESDETWAARISQAFTEHDRHAVVRLVESVEDPAVWENSVATARATSIAADRKSHDTMRAALVAETHICELLQATYEVTRAVPGVSMPLPIRVAPSCGGCPGCRARGLAPRWLLAPAATTEIGGRHRVWASEFLQRATSSLPLVVLLNHETTRADLRRAIERLLERGLGVLDLDTDVELEDSLAPQLRRATILLEHDWVPWHAPNLPAAIVRRATMVQRHLLEPGGPSRVIFAAGSLRDPRHASAALGDYHSNVIDLAHFMSHI